MKTIEEEFKIPFIPTDVVEYLERIYNVDQLLIYGSHSNSDLHLGYMKGVREVISVLRSRNAEQLNKDGEEEE